MFKVYTKQSCRLAFPQRGWLQLDSRDVAKLVEHWTCTLLMQVQFYSVARDFCPRVSFQCRLSYSAHTLLCAIACINICAHVKDPVVHVSVQWIVETLKHSACTIGWVA